MSVSTFLFIIINMIGCLVQTISGFAGTPIAIPPSTVLLGFESAKATVTFLMSCTAFVTAILLIKHIDFRQLGIILLFMGIGDVAGMYFTKILPTKTLLIFYGIIVVAIGVKKLIHPSRKKFGSPWKYIILLFAGIMQGMFSSGGPFAVLYMTNEIENKDTFRGVNSGIWTVLNIYNISTMAIRGYYTPANIRLIMISAIPVFSMIFLGAYIGKRIRKETFLKVVYIILIVSGTILCYNALNQ